MTSPVASSPLTHNGAPGSPGSASTWPRPDSPPMSSPEVLREAQRIVWAIEAMASTPLVDMQDISLVDVSIDSTENIPGGTVRRRLFADDEEPATSNNPFQCPVFALQEAPSSPAGDLVATPESPMMSPSMVIREAERIVLELEALATTPLVDTSPISLIDFDDDDLPTKSKVRRKLFEDEPAETTDNSVREEGPKQLTEHHSATGNSGCSLLTSEAAADWSLVGDARPHEDYLNEERAAPAAQGDEPSVLLACEEDGKVSAPPCDSAPAAVEEGDCNADDH
ncbi:hypothetical protein HPB49_024788 [Dermacentor silvarum]|uniref:Uncharacterized protein n=1 Tax=Dermacentor silvarum TaxID=543639 RepID=A0ACB8E406_DERSI|nr:hypothetical protein HPB49_024788 [Dermacentor silvarum]